MPLSSDIAQGNTRRLVGRKGPAKLAARISVLRPRCGLGFTWNTERSDQYNERRWEMRHHLPALESTTHHRVTDNEKFRR